MATQKLYLCKLCINVGSVEYDKYFTKTEYFKHMKTDEHKENLKKRDFYSKVPLATQQGCAREGKMKKLRKQFSEENIKKLKNKEDIAVNLLQYYDILREVNEKLKNMRDETKE